MASSMTLYSSTSYNEALSLPPSVVSRFFDGKPFADWRKGREAEWKTQTAIVDRLNNVIRACGIVAKTVAKTALGRR